MKKSRKGSALLTVLGMVAFMVVSAVAFSMYMRTSRQPSSYLRRGATSRYMLKAALANAIGRLDGTWRSEVDVGLGTSSDSGFIEGVFDDVYPGFSAAQASGSGKKTTDQYRSRGGRWTHRVFSPFDDVSPDTTVSTLTLEGLAYLPPAIVNEVRLFSRRTRTAQWQNLTYESGRYAFCAVDVSDCFDINKLTATLRTSAGNSRIGFSAMFRQNESAAWSALETGPMGIFNAKVKNVRTSAEGPFVSLADYNLFFGSGDFSPFCSHVGQAGDVQIVKQGDAAAFRSLFITDTWFPPTNTTATARFNLSAGGESQPFDEYDKTWGVEDVLRSAGRTQLGMKLRDRLGGVGTVCLYDYLDADNVPTSYALPTVETAPMVCALGFKANGSGVKPVLKAGSERKATIPGATPESWTEVTATAYEFDWGIDNLHIYGLAAFPFKRLADKQAYATSFKVDALVRVFLAPSELYSHLNADSPVVPRAQADWKDGYANGVITRKVQIAGNLTYSGNSAAQADTVKSFEGDAAIGLSPVVAFWKVSVQKYKKDDNGGVQPDGPADAYYSMDGVAKGSGLATAPLTYDKFGVKASWWNTVAANAKAAMFEDKTTITAADLPVRVAADGKNISDLKCVPHVAVWVKVANAGGEYSGKVVDYVPAYAPDDKIWGLHNESENDEVLTACGDGHPPILRFSGKTGFEYGVAGEASAAAADGSVANPVLYTVDPRFNYAPEGWYAVSGVEPSTLQNGDGWRTSVEALLGGDRDPDLYMFKSDQEYLQSMGELQFLPATRDLQTKPGNIIENYAKWDYDCPCGESLDDVLAFMPGMWQTYSAIDGDPIYNLGDPTLEIVSASNDFRVNPFTQDERVFMSAIANTPYDYFVASTNKNLNLYGDVTQKTAADGLTHAFNSKTSCAMMTDGADDSELVRLADAMRDKFAEYANAKCTFVPWQYAYDNLLSWYDGKKGDEQTQLFGVTLQKPLHMVDRKFLYSYWRECFQNRQQLFLIFLRAEPLTVGGSGKASLASSQLGARGVALVWRDPEPPALYRDKRKARTAYSRRDDWMEAVNKQTPPPHKTRVLFYHQFE